MTHDQEEALTLSDRIFVMNQGKVEQEGCAETIYTQPATEFVARFMGNYNLLSASESRTLLGLEIQGHLAIRPESIQLLTEADAGDSLPAVVRQRQLLGNIIRYQVESAGTLLQVDRLNHGPADVLADGAPVRLRIRRDDMREVR